MDPVTIASFLAFTAAVAGGTYYLTRGTIHDSATGFFLAGRSLGPFVIAGSLLLTNLSTEQLVGLNGGAFADGMVVTAWETLAGVSMTVLALVFLPRYLKSGLTTTPEFLEKRFDGTTRLMTEALFLAGYMFILLPMVLYSGALFMGEVFDIEEHFGLSESAALVSCVWAIGLIGTAYAVFGGLRGVAVSDTLNGLGLLVGGLMIPFFGLAAIAGSDGGILDGWRELRAAQPDKFDAVVSSADRPGVAVPFSTVFTGVILLHLFYWNTNQVIVQRTLAARSLAHGQKGVLLAALIKLLGPLIIVLPGIIAFHLYADQIERPDKAYGVLVREVLPKPLTGFFAAVIAGAILSSFNSALNSAATLFSTGIYKRLLRPGATDHQMVRTGRLFSLGLALVAFFIAPSFDRAPQGLFDSLQKANGCYAIPVLAVMLAALFTRRLPAASAKFGIIFGSLVYLLAAFVVDVPVHEFHLQGIIFVLTLAGMFAIGAARPRPEPIVQEYSGDVDITPWRFAKPVAAIAVAGAVATYLAFS
jgi:SSS family solute:Na+ symporter